MRTTTGKTTPFTAHAARRRTASLGRPAGAIRTLAIVALGLCFALAPRHGDAQTTAAPSAQSSSKTREASREEYRQHLLDLSKIIRNCAQARDMKTCDPAQVGPDDLVPVSSAQNASRALVRHGWLRVLLSKAQDKDAPLPRTKPPSTPQSQSWENVRPLPRTTTQLLEDAQARLTSDVNQIDIAPHAPPVHAEERSQMKQVLAGRDFSGLEETNPKDSTLEEVGNWLNHVLESAIRASARAPWIGRALVWSFISAVCVALVWGLLQLERRWRIRLVPEDRGPAPGAASAIPWQLWLEDARRAAASGQWREAIHFLYWAAISRLESKRLWPADRARTPREYLALVAPDDPRQPNLARLTGSFERVWYGGRAAAEGDYQRAEQLAMALIAGTASALQAPSGGSDSQ